MGDYEIVEEDEKVWMSWSGKDQVARSSFPSIEGARIAAQAHYDALYASGGEVILTGDDVAYLVDSMAIADFR